MLKNEIFPDALKNMSVQQMEELASDIRKELVRTITENGGHLASNLGAVELTIALEAVFSEPEDKIIFDVGHQSYIHKMLTGRSGRFHTIRKKDGLSGFPSIDESERDSFTAGHASTAISAALGLARARDLIGGTGHVVAVVGDGALTGGMCYEAMNDAGQSKTNLIVVLNDNEMSISHNVGAMSEHLTALRQSSSYMHTKAVVRGFLNRIPLIGNKAVRLIERIRDALKTMLVGDRLFEALGFSYYGPINGHDIDALLRAFNLVKNSNRPVVLHVVTQKGHGYEAAEKNPSAYHGLSPINAAKATGMAPSGKIICDLLREDSKENDKICMVVAAMKNGTNMADFFSEYPLRSFDVGIAEEHAVEMAAGLAAGGMMPYVAIYSTFIQRALDQILIDVCRPGLPIVFLLDRSGLVGEDGATHQGVFDLSFFRPMPNMTIAVPADTGDLTSMIKDSEKTTGPMVIRYPKSLPVSDNVSHESGKGEIILEGNDIAVICAGAVLYNALAAAETLKEKGISAAVVNMRYIKPLDSELLEQLSDRYDVLFTVEENTVQGGFGAAILEWCSMNRRRNKVYNIAVPDRFILHASISEQQEECGLDAESIEKYICEHLK